MNAAAKITQTPTFPDLCFRRRRFRLVCRFADLAEDLAAGNSPARLWRGYTRKAVRLGLEALCIYLINNGDVDEERAEDNACDTGGAENVDEC